jgi:hypothetical protein
LLEGVDPQDMLQQWHDMLPGYMQRWALDRAEVRRRRSVCKPQSVRLASPSAPGGQPAQLPSQLLPLLQLVELFGSTRDEWMAADLEGWLAPNRIYPGVAQAIQALMERDEVYIVTTKQVGGVLQQSWCPS